MVTVQEFFDKTTFTLTYVVYDPSSKDAVVIDPVLDYDSATGRVSHHSLKSLLTFIAAKQLSIRYILETHAHADHVSSSQFVKAEFPGAKIGISANITAVQRVFADIFNLGRTFLADGSQFDALFSDGETFQAGTFAIKVLHIPGHTPACVAYVIDSNVFTGDSLFMPDYGTGRCDFPLGSAEALYYSVKQKLFTLPSETRVFTGHDYLPEGRPLKFMSTIGEERRSNIHLRDETTAAEYITFRTARDKNLDAPRLLLPSIQINIAAGNLPTPESNGVAYLKLPITPTERAKAEVT